MEPARKSNLGRSLPWRMYKHGLAYRIVNPDGTKIPLGRDLEEALRRYYVVMVPRSAETVDVADMWKRHRKGAKQRKLAFTVTVEEVHALLADQGNVCAVTGLPFRQDKPEGLRIRPWAPSMDRINGALGYEPGNIRIVCAFVNVAMNGFGEGFFREVLNPLIEAGMKARGWMSENG